MIFLVQESLTEVNDGLKDSESTTESTNTSPLLQSRSMKDFDSDSEPERFDPFHLVVDDVDDERAASVNALDDLAMPSSNTNHLIMINREKNLHHQLQQLIHLHPLLFRHPIYNWLYLSSLILLRYFQLLLK